MKTILKYLLPAGLVLAVFSALGAEAVARPKADWELRRDEIARLREEARAIREEALRAYEKESDACREQTFTASTCIDAANKKRIAADREALIREKKALEIKKANRKEVQAAKQANEQEKERQRASARDRATVKAEVRREKLQLQLDKLRGGQAPADAAALRP